MSKLSVVIPTYNVASIIKECLLSVVFADEIIIVDMGSTDDTEKICQKFSNVKFIKNYPEDGNFDMNRKIGFELATGDWLLKLDSDERLSPDLQKELQNFLKSSDQNKYNGYYFKGKHYLFGKLLSHGLIPKEMRLFRKGFYEYHPEKFHTQIKIKGPTGIFKYPYFHYSCESIYDWFEKMNRYTEYDKQIALKKGKKIPFWKIIFTPIYIFFLSYIFRMGFLEGFHGFIVAVFLAYYSFVEKVKIWEAFYKKNRTKNF